MATVTGLTADRMLAIEAASVVDGDVVGDNLILTKKDGSQINAGSVRGPAGPPGPVGSYLSVLASKAVLDIGLVNQIRAGRQLSPADFANVGLAAPQGLWNLSDLTDVSGNGRNLLNKGSVPFGVGINGSAATAAVFSGSTGQALYITDTGAADPFRNRTGSIGAWIRTAKRGTNQGVMSKWGGSTAGWFLGIDSSNVAILNLSTDGVAVFPHKGNVDVADDHWHFIVATWDAQMTRLYCDGLLDLSYGFAAPAFASPQPLNIGGYGGDGAVAAAAPNYGRVDEAFITSDILSEDQIRNLYCAKIAHTLGAVPGRAALNIRRRRRGGALVVADFPIPPLRLHNFSAGSFNDEGSSNVPLVAQGTTTGIVDVAGADGTGRNAKAFAGAHAGLASTDADLPTALASRSYGCWFKTTSASVFIMGWGGASSAAYPGLRIGSTGGLACESPVTGSTDTMLGPSPINDGYWHFVIATEENAPSDGVKRKLYIDGHLCGVSTVFNSQVSGGANRFRVGSASDGTAPYTGIIDTAFVCGYVLTADQIAALWAKGAQALAPSPKNVGDHVEALNAADLLVLFDTLDSNSQVDLGVAA